MTSEVSVPCGRGIGSEQHGKVVHSVVGKTLKKVPVGGGQDKIYP